VLEKWEGWSGSFCLIDINFNKSFEGYYFEFVFLNLGFTLIYHTEKALYHTEKALRYFKKLEREFKAELKKNTKKKDTFTIVSTGRAKIEQG
jgi:hypothetical protein